jgi:hypothetical protein
MLHTMQAAKGKTILAITIAALFLLSLQKPADAVKFTDKQKKILESGALLKLPVDPKKTGGYKGGKSYILVKDDVDTCYRVMADLKNYYYFYDDTLIEAQVVKKDKNMKLIKMVYGKGPVKMKYHAWYTMLVKQHTIKYKIDQSMDNDMKDGYGYVKFSEYDETRVLMSNVVMVDFVDSILWKILGDKITTGMMRLPDYLKRFLSTPEAEKYRKAAD